jgi:hypothetical protein
LDKFAEYWAALIKLPVAKYARLHVRRWFPVCLPEETEDARTGLKREGFPSEKSLTLDFGPLSEQRLLDEFGVGDYTIRLNDTRRPFEQATILHCEKFATRRDYSNHPPDFKLSRLDWDDPANGPYIKWAQSRGILPVEREYEKEQADMANEQIVSQLLNQNKQLTDQVISSKPVTPAPGPVLPPKSENGDGGAMKAVVDLATAALNRPQPAIPPTSDPMVMVKGMVDIIKEIKPAPDTSATDLAKQVVAQAESANTRIYELQKDQMKDMRAELDRLRTPATTPAAAPLTRRQILEDAVAEQALLKQYAGRGGSAAVEEEDKPGKLATWLEAAEPFVPVLQGIVAGIFGAINFGFQTWQTVSYNNAIGNGKTADPKPPTTMDRPPEPGKPIQPQGPPPTPEQQAQAEQMPQLLAAVSQIIGPLQRALNNSKTGDEFAESMIDFTSDGRADYDKVRNVAATLSHMGMQVPGQPGVEQFKNAAAYLFQQFPAFWAKVGPLPTFGVFLDEFYDYDKIAAEKQEAK